MSTDAYDLYDHKRLHHPKNKEFVTGRANIIKNTKMLFLSIGITVCELINLKYSDRVEILLSKIDRNLILIKKSDTGYRLKWGGLGSNFMRFGFKYETPDNFRLSQTIILEYDFNNSGLLLINLDKLKWKN